MLFLIPVLALIPITCALQASPFLFASHKLIPGLKDAGSGAGDEFSEKSCDSLLLGHLRVVECAWTHESRYASQEERRMAASTKLPSHGIIGGGLAMDGRHIGPLVFGRIHCANMQSRVREGV